jgi:glycosyltransferase involved in cell wall biosynthesis
VRSEHGWENDRLMISTGRLAKEKNWKVLIQAAALVMQDYADFRLAIVGDGPYHRELQNFVTELGLADRIQFLGMVPFQKIPSYLRAGDFFGYASLTETQGIVTMEALAAGLPVVAVDASGTRDTVQNGKQGLLVDNDPVALANAIRRLLDDDQLYARLCAATQERAKTFEMKTLAGKLVEVYEQAIEDKKANRYVQVSDSKAYEPLKL